MESEAPHQVQPFLTPKIAFGQGVRRLAGLYAANYGAHKVLIVTDPGVLAAGLVEPVTAGLREEWLAHIVFADVHPNPRIEEVEAGAELFTTTHCDLIIAVGGGSAIDCAKGIALAGANHPSILSLARKNSSLQPIIPLICLPTTAGSGADLSQRALLSDPSRQVKVTIAGKALLPTLALIDPEATATLDPHLTACTAFEALAQAIEAYTSRTRVTAAGLHALEGIRLIRQHLLAAVRAPNDLKARRGLMLGSLHAGLASSSASFGPVLALANSLGGHLDLPTGECCALLLEHESLCQFSAVGDRGQRIAAAFGLDLHGLSVPAQSERLAEALAGLRAAAGISSSLGKLGVQPADISELACKALQDPGLANGLPPVNQAGLEAVLRAAL